MIGRFQKDLIVWKHVYWGLSFSHCPPFQKNLIVWKLHDFKLRAARSLVSEGLNSVETGTAISNREAV